MADPIPALDEQRISYAAENLEGVPAIRPIDLSPPQGSTSPQTHVVVSLTD